MFESNGNCGYVLKPRAMWDVGHVMYGAFNPWTRETPGVGAVYLNLSVVSGQHLCPCVPTANLFVEVEIFGVLADCAKERTKAVSRNGVNPIWSQSFNFRMGYLTNNSKIREDIFIPYWN
uniref:PI-PLC Y-box domain-containing protein n=1 Tax=Romanomermis culicivorax TaxID=13658 RepID=A0A915IXP9_ROMCU